MSEDAAVLIVERACPNCGAESSGVYCPQCGERMEPRVLRIRHYLRDIAQEVLSLDTKLLNTVPALLFHPGFLAQEFVAGRRKRYLSPLRLHIIIAILLFLSIGHFTRTRMENQLDAANKRQNIDSVLTAVRTQNAQKGDTTKIPTVDNIKQASEYIGGMVTEVGPYVLLVSSIPAFALFLALLYRKRKKIFVEHLMFSIYFFSFAYLILIPPILWLHKILFPISCILVCAYLYFALRRYYDDRGFKLVLRSIAGIVSCVFIGGFAFLLSYVISYGIGLAFGNLPSNIHGTINF